MSEVDRELRDRLEEAQTELKRAQGRLDQLEDVAADRDLLRHELSAAQADLKSATDRLNELEDQSVEQVMAELDEVTRDRDLLRQRLEQADKMREQWDGKLSQREIELAAVRAEEARLRGELASVTSTALQPLPPPKSRIALFMGLSGVVALGTAILLWLSAR